MILTAALAAAGGFAFGLRFTILPFAVVAAASLVATLLFEMIDGAGFMSALVDAVLVLLALQAGYAAAILTRIALRSREPAPKSQASLDRASNKIETPPS